LLLFSLDVESVQHHIDSTTSLLSLYHNRKSAFCSLQPQPSSFQPPALCLCHLDCFLPSPAQATVRRLVFDASLHRVASLPSSAVLFVCFLSIDVPLHVHLLDNVPSTLIGESLLGRSRRGDPSSTCFTHFTYFVESCRSPSFRVDNLDQTTRMLPF
jgi:hypothetical protein